MKLEIKESTFFPIDSNHCIRIEQTCNQGEGSYDELVDFVKKHGNELQKYEAVIVSPHQHVPCKVLLAYLHSIDADALGKRRSKYIEFEIMMRIYGETQILKLIKKLKEEAKQTQLACLYLISMVPCEKEIQTRCKPDSHMKIIETHLELIT